MFAGMDADAVMPLDEQQPVLSLEDTVEAWQRTVAHDKQEKVSETVPGEVPSDDVAEADWLREVSLDTVRGRTQGRRALERGDLETQGCCQAQRDSQIEREYELIVVAREQRLLGVYLQRCFRAVKL